MTAAAAMSRRLGLVLLGLLLWVLGIAASAEATHRISGRPAMAWLDADRVTVSIYWDDPHEVRVYGDPAAPDPPADAWPVIAHEAVCREVAAGLPLPVRVTLYRDVATPYGGLVPEAFYADTIRGCGTGL